MKMAIRWFGEKDDHVPLWKIRQIPGRPGIVGTLLDVPTGEVWPVERIRRLKETVERAGLEMEVIESVNIHDDIKIGLPGRDRWIDNYRRTLQHLAGSGIRVVCYNFMPVFDWIRSDLARVLPDGSTTMAYEEEKIPHSDPQRPGPSSGCPGSSPTGRRSSASSDWWTALTTG